MTRKFTPADEEFYIGMSARGISKELRDQYNREYNMAKQETITLNGKTYKEVDPKAKDIQPAIETDHIIVIAQRGWIFEGHRDRSVNDKIQLLNASVVRSWSNGRGIGGLAKKDYKGDYKLDPVGTVSFPNEGIIASVDITEW